MRLLVIYETSYVMSFEPERFRLANVERHRLMSKEEHEHLIRSLREHISVKHCFPLEVQKELSNFINSDDYEKKLNAIAGRKFYNELIMSEDLLETDLSNITIQKNISELLGPKRKTSKKIISHAVDCLKEGEYNFVYIATKDSSIKTEIIKLYKSNNLELYCSDNFNFYQFYKKHIYEGIYQHLSIPKKLFSTIIHDIDKYLD